MTETVVVDKKMDAAVVFFTLLQVYFTFLPLPGYIHPDEFFQSPEIAASDVFNFTVVRTWEWQNKEPLRSPLTFQVNSALSFNILKLLSSNFGITLTPYLLIIFPRLLMLIYCFLMERMIIFMLKAIFKRNTSDIRFSKILFKSSHLVLVFFARTFSNNIEMFSICLLLYVIFQNFNCEKRNKANWMGTIFLGSFTALNIFIRPVFVCFAVYPLVYYTLCNRSKNSHESMIKWLLTCVISTGLWFAVGFLPTCLFCYWYERIYYNHSTLPTPINFFRYNTKSSNLIAHGLHPIYLHFTINAILMFGPLYLCVVIKSICLLKHNFMQLKNVATVFQQPITLLIGSFIVPIIILSTSAHQEPRFIIACVIPLFLLAPFLIRSPKSRLITIRISIIYTIAMVLWYGFMHQAGILPCLVYVKNLLSNSNNNNHKHIIFWRTYMPPTYILGITKDSNFEVNDLAGMDVPKFKDFVSKIACKSNRTGEEQFGQKDIFLALPGLLMDRLPKSFLYYEITSFFPHISGEDPPWLSKRCLDFSRGLFFWIEECKSVSSLHLLKLDCPS